VQKETQTEAKGTELPQSIAEKRKRGFGNVFQQNHQMFN
jgi:hypothetical protein